MDTRNGMVLRAGVVLLGMGLTAWGQAPASGTLVVVLKDGREQVFAIGDVARIDFRGAAKAPGGGTARDLPTLGGTWRGVWEAKGVNQAGYRITQNGDRLTFVSADGKSTSTGFFRDAETVVAEQWGNVGKVKNGGKTIQWDNGSHWER